MQAQASSKQAVIHALPLPTQSFEVITPALAHEWLKFNTNNRPLSRTRVEELKRVFGRGEYKITHQGVAFDTEGVLQDGQHRLVAVSEMPEPFSIVISVARNVDKDAYKVIDQVYKRTYGQSLRIDSGLSEASKFLASTVFGPGSMSPTRLQPFVDFVKPFIDQLLVEATAKRRTWSSASVRAAAIIQMARGVPVDYVRSVYRALVTADFDAMPVVAQCMFRTELNGRVSAQEKNDAFARCLKMFDPAYANYKKLHVGDASVPIAEVRDFMKMKLGID